MIDPRTGYDVSIDQAVESGLVNYEYGVYYNPIKKRSISIPKAIDEGRIFVSPKLSFCLINATEVMSAVIAHNDFAIYSCQLHHQLFQKFRDC